MPFFQVDDNLHSNPKAMKLLETAVHGDVSGPAALGLWTAAGSLAQDAGLDGLISETQLLRLLLHQGAVEILAGKLVEVDLWHRPGHHCPDCDAVPEGHYRFHQWFQFNYDTGKETRLDRAKKKELGNPKIKAEVWARDSTDGTGKQGHCRYCGHLVKQADKKGERRPEMDHVDPGLAIGSSNIVLCCASCNRQKGRRTPEQAGLTLRDAPRSPLSSAEVESDPAHGGTTNPSVMSSGERVEPAEVPPRGGVPPDQNRISSDISQISGRYHADSAVYGPARGLAGSGGVGLGEEGTRQGGQQGRHAEQGSSGKRRRRRSRGRKKNQPAQQSQQQSRPGRAGEAPEVQGYGQFGSPWYGHRGRPGDAEDSTCAEHGLAMPCRRCKDGSW